MEAAQPDQTVRDRMRDEWNERAREDANYYVAFGRRDQEADEFFASGSDVVRDLEGELKRFPSDVPMKSRRALEIGCGPGRLIRPMSEYFGEIHGIDVSDEMIARSQANLAGIAHAHTHHASGSDLARFADDYFDFVYSYAVFQHIPSAAVVFSYLRETVRVLKPGGFARLQINGLPKTAPTYTTWSGVRISAHEVREFALQSGMEVLSITGVDTQYMWTSWRKPESCAIRHIVSASTGEPAAPQSGPLASISLHMQNLPAGCDLNSLNAFIDDVPATGCYIGPAVNRLTQFNVMLPPGIRTGLLPVRVLWNGRRICPDSVIRVIPPGPAVPRLVAVSDGVNLMSPQRVESGSMKAIIEEAQAIDTFTAWIDGTRVTDVESFCTDPLADRYEVNFQLPETCGHGGHVLELKMGHRRLTLMGIEVVR